MCGWEHRERGRKWGMKKYRKVCTALTAIVFLVIGGVFTIGHRRYPDLKDLSDNHPAVKMYYSGYWEGRYESHWATTGANETIGMNGITLSINVLKDMTREEMVSVLGYYELVGNAEFVGSSYVGERDTDFLGYAVFFRGDTEEELARVKYFNGAEAEITEEDKGCFPPPYFHQEDGGKTGPWF